MIEVEAYRGMKGWGKPANSDEEHYFVGRYSLCGKWALFARGLRLKPDINFVACQECSRLQELRLHTPLAKGKG